MKKLSFRVLQVSSSRSQRYKWWYMWCPLSSEIFTGHLSSLIFCLKANCLASEFSLKSIQWDSKGLGKTWNMTKLWTVCLGERWDDSGEEPSKVATWECTRKTPTIWKWPCKAHEEDHVKDGACLPSCFPKETSLWSSERHYDCRESLAIFGSPVIFLQRWTRSSCRGSVVNESD